MVLTIEHCVVGVADLQTAGSLLCAKPPVVARAGYSPRCQASLDRTGTFARCPIFHVPACDHGVQQAFKKQRNKKKTILCLL